MPKGRTAAMARLAARFGRSARSAPIGVPKKSNGTENLKSRGQHAVPVCIVADRHSSWLKPWSGLIHEPQFRDLKATESILRRGFASQGQLCPGFHVFQDDFNLLAHKKAARAMTQTALKPSFGIQR